MKKILCLCLLIIASSTQISGCSSFIAASSGGPIEDDPGKRTWGTWLEDENIETKSLVNLKQADEGFKDSHLVVVCYNGSVLLAGQVSSNELRNKAPDVVRQVRNVKRIYNELTVTGNTSAVVRSNDAWITAKLKTAMYTSREIQGGRTKVVTENGVVYLMGLVTRAEAERIVEVASSVYGVQKVVQLFELID